jgi:hypothetical protein
VSPGYCSAKLHGKEEIAKHPQRLDLGVNVVAKCHSPSRGLVRCGVVSGWIISKGSGGSLRRLSDLDNEGFCSCTNNVSQKGHEIFRLELV